MSGYMKGPWYWDDEILRCPAGVVMRAVAAEPADVIIDVRQKDADLIASAPELLESLTELYWAIPEEQRMGQLSEYCDSAQAAIAKARGEKQ